MSTFAEVPTGSRSSCVSNMGAYDMGGNLKEWVADWGDIADGCNNWSGACGNDESCYDGEGVRTRRPG